MARVRGCYLDPCSLNNHGHPDVPWGRDAHGVSGTRQAQQLLGWGWNQLCLLAAAAKLTELGKPTGYRVVPSAVPGWGQAPAVPKGHSCLFVSALLSQPSGQSSLIDPGSGKLWERMVLPVETARVP